MIRDFLNTHLDLNIMWTDGSQAGVRPKLLPMIRITSTEIPSQAAER